MKPSEMGFHPSWDQAVEDLKKKEKKMLSSVWDIGFRDRGLGHGDFGVIVKKTGEIVVECPNHAIAGHIVELHNNSIKKPKKK